MNVCFILLFNKNNNQSWSITNLNIFYTNKAELLFKAKIKLLQDRMEISQTITSINGEWKNITTLVKKKVCSKT